MKKSGQVISASRRTDIPAHFVPWFLKRLEAGYVLVRQPYSGKVRRVSLLSEDIDAIVFWTKNPSPLLSHIESVVRTAPNLFFHITLTAAPRDMEPSRPPEVEVLDAFRFLSRRFSPGHLVWRFDPIVTDPDTGFDAYEHAFTRLAEQLRGVVHTCVTSYVHPYAKVKARFSSVGRQILNPGPEARLRFARRLAFIAARMDMTLRVCCNEDLVLAGIPRANCIDRTTLADLFAQKRGDGRATPTRRGCGCSQSLDVGAYNTCPSGCLYCYASGPGHPSPVGEHQSGMGFDEGALQD